jgi:hypothetical protein
MGRRKPRNDRDTPLIWRANRFCATEELCAASDTSENGFRNHVSEVRILPRALLHIVRDLGILPGKRWLVSGRR